MIGLNKNRTASFLVDAQCGFTNLCPDELPVPDGENIVKECLKTFEYTSLKIASKDAHPNNAQWITKDKSKIGTKKDVFKEDQMDLYWPLHCSVGTQGFELIPGFPPIEEFDFIIYKGIERNIHCYSACYHLLKPGKNNSRISTGIIEFLRSMKINCIIMLGLATNYCVKSTAMDLATVGFDVIINFAGCRGIGDLTDSREIMAKAGIEFINSSNDLKLV